MKLSVWYYRKIQEVSQLPTNSFVCSCCHDHAGRNYATAGILKLCLQVPCKTSVNGRTNTMRLAGHSENIGTHTILTGLQAVLTGDYEQYFRHFRQYFGLLALP